jgi:hypothetical protein
MRKIFVAIFLFLLVSAGSLPAQQTQPAPNQQAQSPGKIAVEVKTVSVLATVRDKHGKIISDLAKDDFVLEEDGRPQNINYFERESDQPLRLGQTERKFCSKFPKPPAEDCTKFRKKKR